MALPDYSNYQYPNFNTGGNFPYQNFLQQLYGAFIARPMNSYGRWNGTGVTTPQGYPAPNTTPNGPPGGYGNGGLLSGGGGLTVQPQGGSGPQPQAGPGQQPQGASYDQLPQGAHVLATSQAAAGMTPAEQQARAMLSYSSNPMGLYAALGQQMASRGMSQSDIANALNSFGGTAGANGGAQLSQVRGQYGTNYGDAFANTPYAQFFQNRAVRPSTGASASLPGLLG